MMKKTIILALWAFLAFSGASFCAEDNNDEIRFDFEYGTEGWEIPDWAFDLSKIEVYKGVSAETSTEEASVGNASLKMICDYPGDEWTAAIVEKAQDMDLREYNTISADIFIPRSAPRLLEGRLILTVGDGWLFTQMRESVPLKPGKWTTVEAKLENKLEIDPDTGEPKQSAWRGRKQKRLCYHIDKVKKVAVRVEYNAAPPSRTGSRYKGPVYIDNVVIKK